MRDRLLGREEGDGDDDWAIYQLRGVFRGFGALWLVVWWAHMRAAVSNSSPPQPFLFYIPHPDIISTREGSIVDRNFLAANELTAKPTAKGAVKSISGSWYPAVSNSTGPHRTLHRRYPIRIFSSMEVSTNRRPGSIGRSGSVQSESIYYLR